MPPKGKMKLPICKRDRRRQPINTEDYGKLPEYLSEEGIESNSLHVNLLLRGSPPRSIVCFPLITIIKSFQEQDQWTFLPIRRVRVCKGGEGWEGVEKIGWDWLVSEDYYAYYRPIVPYFVLQWVGRRAK